jgi:uncharacterized metal-binding protein YceD (DUF177 family)
VNRHEFSVPLADIESGPKVLDSAITEQWLSQALEGTGAVPRGGAGRLHVELAKNGRDVLVRGYAQVAVNVPCVVTLDPLPFDLRPEILLLLSPGDGGTKLRGKAPRSGQGKRRPAGKKGKGSRAWTEEPELSAEEAARDHFSGDEVVLDEFVREFITLELPMYPRRSDLPSAGDAAIGPAPQPEGPPALDPRLKPLAELAKRLGTKADNKE